MKNYRIFLSSKNETWMNAIDRFHTFCQTDMKDYFSEKDYSYYFKDNKAYAYQVLGKVSQEHLSNLSTEYSINIPQNLIEILSQHSPFKIGDSLLEIYGESIENNNILNLSQILQKYGYYSFEEQISRDVLKSLNGYYLFFGVSFPESEEMSFLFFNKAGNFGKMQFTPNNPDFMLKKILPSMFNGSTEKYTLDSLISKQIDRVIINALTVRGYID